jgi:hypothetical protein
MIRWRKTEGLYPEEWVSTDERFVIRRTSSRYNIRPRPVTVTKVILVDKETGGRWEGARILRDAKERAEAILAAERVAT